MDLLEKLHRIKWFQHSFNVPTNFYEHIVATPNSVSKFIGLNLFSPNHKDVDWRILSCFFMVFIYFCLTGTSAYDMRNDPEDLVYCFVTIGIAIHFLAKAITFVVFKKEIVWLHQYNLTLYKEECDIRSKKLLMNNLFLLSVIIKVMLVAYPFTAFSLVSGPVLYGAKTGERILPYGFFLPFIDRFAWSGYIVNYVLQLYYTVMISSGEIGPECIYMILTVGGVTQIDLLVSSLQELSRKINDEENYENDLKMIIKRHQEHLKYVRIVDTVFRAQFFVTFVSLSSVIITTLFAVLIMSWYQGYVFIVFLSYQLGFVCFLGTLLSVKNEQLQREIYNISWYKLPIQDQKSVRFILQAAQEPVCLSMIFAPLNMPTFLSVYKTLYSIFTVFRMVVTDE